METAHVFDKAQRSLHACIAACMLGRALMSAVWQSQPNLPQVHRLERPTMWWTIFHAVTGCACAQALGLN